jgi:hypothetical protein
LLFFFAGGQKRRETSSETKQLPVKSKRIEPFLRQSKGKLKATKQSKRDGLKGQQICRLRAVRQPWFFHEGGKKAKNLKKCYARSVVRAVEGRFFFLFPTLF